MRSTTSSLCVVAAVCLLWGCGGSFPRGAERLSSKDQAPKGARLIKPAKYGQVLEGTVSSPLKDRTDFWSVDLKKDSTLTVKLHWSNGRSKLELAILDPMGRKLVDGLGWGSGGLRAVAAVQDPGRYPIRVRARGVKDESSYTLKVQAKSCSGGGGGGGARGGSVCHNCKVGQRTCLGTDRTISCVKLGPDCSAWAVIEPCVKGVACVDGACGSCHKCKKEARRCQGPTHYRVCAVKNGCLDWGPARACGGKKRCHRGTCAIIRGPRCGDDRCDKPRENSTNCPRDCPVITRCVKGKIQTMYTYNGRMTMHIVIGQGTPVRAGHKGYLLEGGSNRKLPGSEFRVTRVSGDRAIAVTKLERLGRNRFVCIQPR